MFDELMRLPININVVVSVGDQVKFFVTVVLADK